MAQGLRAGGGQPAGLRLSAILGRGQFHSSSPFTLTDQSTEGPREVDSPPLQLVNRGWDGDFALESSEILTGRLF